MAVGIIAEYNPLHNGHKYMLDQIKRSHGIGIVVCISGSLTQRGELAILNKWQRARLAVQNGANLVIELPTAFACRSAEAFAMGGVRLLASLGIIDTLAFGTEYPDLAKLQLTASFQPELHKKELQEKLATGLSYGNAISQLIAEKLKLPPEMLREPNTILALEYLKAMQKYPPSADGQIPLTPLPILRTGSGHNDSAASDNFASGTLLRELIYAGNIRKAKDFVPAATLLELEQITSYPNANKLLQLVKWQLLTTPPTEIATICGVNEGLEHKLQEAIHQPSLPDLVQHIATRRYPATRVQRLLLHLLLKFTQEKAKSMDLTGPLYVRVLAFDDIGRQLLRDIRQKSNLPIITKTTAYLNSHSIKNPYRFTPLQNMLYLDVTASNLRELCCAPLTTGTQNLPPTLNLDFTTSPIYFKGENHL